MEAYHEDLMAAAAEARVLYTERQKAAAKRFHKKYPDGKLPDEEFEDAA